MLRCRFRLVIVSAAISLLYTASLFSAEMLRLTESGDFKPLSEYEKKVAQLKKLVEDGQCDAAKEAYEQLKKDFPGTLGLDTNDPKSLRAFDDFVEAEMYLCKRKFTKAVSSYNSFLYRYPEKTRFAEVAFDRQLYVAEKFLAGQKRKVLGIFKIKRYGEGARIIQRIIERKTFDSLIARRAAETLAESYERRGKFEHAYDKWFDVYWELSKAERRQMDPSLRKKALLRMAQCKHAAYRGPKYDAAALEIARMHYEDLKENFPELSPSEKNDVDKRIKLINEQLAYKQFCIGRYYQKTGSKLAANSYYRMIEDDYELEQDILKKWQETPTEANLEKPPEEKPKK